MRTKALLLLTILTVIVVGCAPQALRPAATPVAQAAPPAPAPAELRRPLEFTQISFDDLAPPGMDMRQCWNGMGMDDQGRIYIGFTSVRQRQREDFAVFRYDPKTGRREFLGTFLDVVATAGNAKAGESIPKGHTRMVYADGKMYMGSQSFHDLKREITTLPTFRGSHLFAYAIATGAWQDLSASLPGGVVTEHEGIIALNILPNEHLLVGLAHPSSDIVLFDYQTNGLVKVVPGIPWKLGNPLSREVIVAPSGNIYTYRGTEEVSQRSETHTVWVYNLRTGAMKDTGYKMTNGFWIGQTQRRDGSKIYLNTTGGELYEFDVATETFSDLGYGLPPHDKRVIGFTYAVQLSPDEKRLYYILSIIEKPDSTGYMGSGGSGELYYLDLTTREVVFVQQLPMGIYTSADLRDDEHLYFSHFGAEADIWSGKPGLFILHMPQRRSN
jgi:hypothetical protein